MTAIARVAVCVATYRRPDGLRALLDSLAAIRTTATWRVIVVDNDPAGSAWPVVESSRVRDRLEYAVEEHPGIPAARNRCLDMLHDDDQALVFVDDDEVVDPDWLTHLLQAAHDFGVDVVAGPVISEFPVSAPRWMRADGVIQAPIQKTGTRVGSPFTNNSLITVRALQVRGTRFDERGFADTGGSDRDFFDRLLEKNAVRWVWCAEAEVREKVPPERATLRWIMRRGLRTGNVMGRLQLRQRSRPAVMLGGVTRAVVGFAGALILWLPRPELAGRAFVGGAQGLGMCASAWGHHVREYARDN